jgi:hypothetical protein
MRPRGDDVTHFLDGNHTIAKDHQFGLTALVKASTLLAHGMSALGLTNESHKLILRYRSVWPVDICGLRSARIELMSGHLRRQHVHELKRVTL